MEKNQHPIFYHDPKDWTELVHCRVRVDTNDSKKHTGFVYTVDPVSQSLVLINSNDSNGERIHSTDVSMKIILRASVKKIEVLHAADEDIKSWFNTLFRTECGEKLSAKDLDARKEKLKQWLEKNRIPVSVSQDQQSLSIFDALVIRPPYTAESCLSTNEIILLRIQGLVRNMPSTPS